MEETRILAFLALMAGVAALIPWAAHQARKRGSDEVQRALQEIAARGFAVEATATAHGRSAVRVWGMLEHPVPFDLRIARRSRLARAVAGGSAGMLDPVFEQSYRVHSRAPERARLVLDPEMQRLLLATSGAELRLGSFESLLPREYAVGAGVDEGRRLRGLWMLRVPGRLAKLGDPAPLGDLGRRLSAAVSKHGMAPGTPDRSAYETGASESWI